MRVSRLPRGKARIVRGFCDFAVGVTILLYAAPFRAIWSADWRVLGADYGADRRADFPPKMRVFGLSLSFSIQIRAFTRSSDRRQDSSS